MVAFIISVYWIVCKICSIVNSIGIIIAVDSIVMGSCLSRRYRACIISCIGSIPLETSSRSYCLAGTYMTAFRR